jgi:translation initiation factor IF-2
VVYSGVSEVTSSDVAIAAVAKAKIIAFNVGSNFVASEAARASNVDVGYYDVVYTLLDEMQERIQVLLAPPPPGSLVGRATIKKVFKLGKVGKVAGCEVTEGVIRMESKCRVMRGKRNPVYTGTLSSLKVVKENKAEVPSGSECGISFEKFQDFEEGDVIECFVGGDGDNNDDSADA